MHLDWSLATWLSSMKAANFLLCNQSRALALRWWRWSLGFDLKECQGVKHLCNHVFNQSCILYVDSGHRSLCSFFFALSLSLSLFLSPTLIIHVIIIDYIILRLHNRLRGEWLFRIYHENIPWPGIHRFTSAWRERQEELIGSVERTKVPFRMVLLVP